MFVVAFQLVQAVVDVSPDAGELAGQVDRCPADCLAGPVEGEECAAGQLDPSAGVAHLSDRVLLGARELAGHDDSGLHLGDGPGLFDCGRLADC